MKTREILEAKEKEIRSQIEASTDAAEVRALSETLKAIVDDIKELDAAVEEREKVPAGAVLRNGAVLGNGKADGEDIEYRTAFMNFVLHNVPIEKRDDANTLTTDVGSAIPTVVANRIIDRIENSGMILALVTKTNFAAGVEIPTSTLKPVATWVAEGASSDRQKVTTGTVSFTHHKLRCEVSMSMEVGTMTLEAFENKFVENVANAMVKAIEQAIVNGDGTGKPKGILAETPLTGQSISAVLNYENLVAAEGALPEEYESSAKWCMSKKTFAKIQGMTDSTGQPIARVTYGLSGKMERAINGREVVIAPYVPADTAFIFDFADYVFNTIYNMGIQKKQDWDTEDLLTKAVLAADGKVVDKSSLVVYTIQPSA